MKSNMIISGLSGFAGAALFFIVTSFTNTNQVQPVLRGQQLELVDANGKVRVSIKTEETETIFRMMDSSGTIRVKLGGGKDGSALVLLDGDTNPGVHVLSKSTGTSLTMISKEGKKLVLIPDK